MNAPVPSPSSAPQAPAKKNDLQKKIFMGAAVLVVVMSVGGGIYLWEESRYVYTDKAQISAPLIPLGPQTAGILRSVSVREGDQLSAGEVVAGVGEETIQTRVSGIAMTVNRDIGAPYKSGQPVVVMFEPKELRVVARVKEDEGLRNIYVGQKAVFTLDAFGSEQFEGTVETIAQKNRSGDVVFNISDQREEQEYEVKIRYAVADHPEFLNGMSAKVWIVK